MFTAVEAAVQTLEDAGALSYTISQLAHLKLTGDADGTQALLDKFLIDWEKLAPGIYKVDYSKNPQDKRTGLCFRINKTAQAAGSVQQVAGIGGPNDVISGLQQQIWNLETDAKLREQEARHREEIRALKLKQGDDDGAGLLGPLLGALPRLENLLYMATGRQPLSPAAPAVAGPALPPAPPSDGAALNDDGNRLAAALDKLQNGLGPETLLDVLDKLASKDANKLRQLAGMIDML